MKEGIEVQNPTAWGVGTSAAALGTSGGATTFGSTDLSPRSLR